VAEVVARGSGNPHHRNHPEVEEGEEAMPPIKVIPAGPYTINEASINDVPVWRVAGPRVSVWCGTHKEAIQRRTEMNMAYLAGQKSKKSKKSKKGTR